MSRFPPLPAELLHVAARRSGYVTAHDCTRLGVLSDSRRRRVEAGLWDRPAPGVLDTDPHAARTPSEQRVRAAHLALVRCGDDAVATGVAALALHGNRGLPLRIRATAARADHQDRPGQLVSQHRRFEVVTLAGGTRAATVPWALTQSATQLGRLHLTAAVDSALASGTLSSIDAVRELTAGRRGARHLRCCLDLADGRAESFLETWARLECVDAGIPPDAVQLPIQLPDGRVLRGDLAWRLPGGRWLVVEIDGREVHEHPEAAYADRARQNALVAAGRIVVLRFTVQDLRRPGYVPAQIRKALGR
ncbi:hypothetical protein C8046_13225 [Serinibacter arcticus]|uniref:DUF559 domain-containing protein n=1 Tax=Serinibacter arcticus TaxID=1655435 RepID=A0A2U1ZX10_9MICO|nr:hypothetical protein [Serinibacter arcticus]PWD51473.1 hypothetical protein C8046_13225 [Serinibacter arcticus]